MTAAQKIKRQDIVSKYKSALDIMYDFCKGYIRVLLDVNPSFTVIGTLLKSPRSPIQCIIIFTSLSSSSYHFKANTLHNKNTSVKLGRLSNLSNPFLPSWRLYK
jgi:hypothetical protein